MTRKLTNKQQLFCVEYIIDFNATKAATRAGYSEKTAGNIGHELLKKPEIEAAVEKAKEDRAKRTMITADWVLTRLVAEAEADVNDLYNEDGSIKPVKEWPMVWRQGLVQGMDVDEVRSGGTKIGEISKLKLSDRAKRLEMIGKHVNVQAFSDKQQVDTSITLNISDKDADTL